MILILNAERAIIILPILVILEKEILVEKVIIGNYQAKMAMIILNGSINYKVKVALMRNSVSLIFLL